MLSEFRDGDILRACALYCPELDANQAHSALGPQKYGLASSCSSTCSRRRQHADNIGNSRDCHTQYLHSTCSMQHAACSQHL